MSKKEKLGDVADRIIRKKTVSGSDINKKSFCERISGRSQKQKS